MSDRTQQLIEALAPLALAADLEAKVARTIAETRADVLERAVFLDRAARWQTLYAIAASAMLASMGESDGYGRPTH